MAESRKTLADWAKLVEKELAGKGADSLVWNTPEGIAVKPLYTADDVPAQAGAELPGFAPFTRGVRA